jgi:hypothetical protein
MTDIAEEDTPPLRGDCRHSRPIRQGELDASQEQSDT